MSFRAASRIAGRDRYLTNEPDPEEDEEVRDDLRLKDKMLLCVDDWGLAMKIDQAATARRAWEVIRAEYEADVELRVPILIHELGEARQGSSETYADYIDRVDGIRVKLQDTGFESGEQLAVNALIKGLKESSARGSLVVRLTELAVAGFTAVVSSLKSSVRLLEGVERPVGRSGGAAEGRVMHMDDKKKQKKETRRCYNCGETGHLKRDCKKPRKKNDVPGVIMMTSSDVQGDAAVYYDSAATEHYIKDLRYLRDPRPSAQKRVFMGGGEPHDVISEGDVWLRGGPSGIVKLQNVLCVPTLTADLLLSGAKVDEAGFTSTQGGGRCIVADSAGKVCLEGLKVGRLYHMSCEMLWAPEAEAGQVHAVVAWDDWHRRLAHAGEPALRLFAEAAGLKGIKKNPDASKCDVCAEARQAREPFQRSESQATERLELLHSDVVGPIHVPSIGGACYAVTLMDDCTRMAELKCIARKSDAFEWMKTTMRQWERQTGCKAKTVRTDHGTEFLGRLQAFFDERGIVHQTSADYTPEQNGRAERLNRTVFEKVRAQLHEFKLPHSLWAAAADTACFIRNCTPVTGTSVSPYEAFYGKAPDVSRMRVFGCKAYVHVPAVKRKKLHTRAEIGVFVGYPRHSKAWRVYVVRKGKWVSVESRNVRFDERCAPTMPELRAPSTYVEFDAAVDALWAVEETPPDQHDGDDPGDGVHGEDVYADMPDLDPASDDEEIEFLHGDGLGGEQPDAPPGGLMPAAEAVPERRYPVRERRAPTHAYQPYLYKVEGLTDEPRTPEEALARSDGPLWRQSMDAEWASLMEKGVLQLATVVPRGKRVLPMKAVMKIKRDNLGAVDKYKTRLVVLGCLQVAGRDVNETYAPTAQQATLRVLLALAAEMNLDLHQFDVATAFLNGELEEDEEIYVRMPAAFGGQTYRLRKALYGLKQAARAWHVKLRDELLRIGFTASDADPCLFFRGDGEHRVYVLVHVDDGIVVGYRAAVQAAMAAIAGAFDVKIIGEARFFLGLEIRRDRDLGLLWLGQTKYVHDMLERFGMTECKAVSTPLEANVHLGRDGGVCVDEHVPYAELVGSLLYLVVNTRPDLSYAVGVLSRFMACAGEVHWKAAKRVLRYIAGTSDRGITYRRGEPAFCAYSDSDYAGDPDARKSTSGMVALMYGGVVMWRSKLQTVVAASTCEAEYIAFAAATKDVLWLRKLLAEMQGRVQRLQICGDNQSALALMRQHSPGAAGRTKHIDTAFHFVRHRVMQGDVEAIFVRTSEMKADLMTKALPGPGLEQGAAGLGLRNFSCS